MKINRRIKDYIIYELQMYHENKRQLEECKRDIVEGKDYTVSDMPRGGNTSDTTYSKAEKLLSSTYIQNIERTLNVIDRVIKGIDENRYKIIDMLYWKKTHTAIGVSLEVNISERTVYRWVDGIIYAIAKELGYIK